MQPSPKKMENKGFVIKVKVTLDFYSNNRFASEKTLEMILEVPEKTYWGNKTPAYTNDKVLKSIQKIINKYLRLGYEMRDRNELIAKGII